MNDSNCLRLTVAAWMLVTLAACDGRSVRREELAPIPVKTAVVQPKDFSATIRLLGSVHPSETIVITTPATATIHYSSRFRSGLRTGEHVKAGEVLAILTNESSRVALGEAGLAAEQARVELDRARRSLEAGIIAQASLSEAEVHSRLAEQRLESARRQSRRLVLTAPRAGNLIVTNSIAPGSEISPQTEIVQVAVGGMPRVVAWVAAADRAKLRKGQRVKFSSSAGAEVGDGVIEEVATVVEQNGTAKVVASAVTAASLPAPGEGVEIEVALDTIPSVLAVPEEALVVGAGGASVFVVQDRSAIGSMQRVRRVAVITGTRGGGEVEIRSGLSNGDRVVTSGATFLSDGALVTETTDGQARLTHDEGTA